MHQQVGNDEHRKWRHHWQIAPVLPNEDFARGDRKQRRRKGKIGDHRQPSRNVGRDDASEAAQQPQTSQHSQSFAAHRQTARPVGNGSEQKSGDGGHDEAEQHLVDVPRERIEAGGSCR